MRLMFEFRGGPRDGERLAGSTQEASPSEAGSYYRHTNGAPVGARFWCSCEYACTALRSIPWDKVEQLELAGYRFRGHIYEVAERTHTQGVLIAQARYVWPSV